MPWRLEREVLIAGALRIAVQRIGIAHWQPAQRLQSWGLASLHREGNAVYVPCDASEALWLGVWLEDGADAAHVELHHASASGSISLPPDGQLSALCHPCQRPQPLTLASSVSASVVPLHGAHQELALELLLNCGSSRAKLKLVLLPPLRWALRAGRTPAAPRATPPPRPPRLG